MIARAARLALGLCLLLAACSTPRFQESPPLPKPPADVLPIVLDILGQDRFQITSVEPQRVEAEDIQLTGSYLTGTRRVAVVRLQSTEQGTVIGIRVMKEVNENITTPGSIEAAEWGRREQDPESETLLMYRIKEKVSPTVLPPSARERAPARRAR